jgi:hypothetical protein
MSAGRRRLPLLVLAVGAMGVAIIVFTYDPAPVIPRDRDHVAISLPEGCLVCHGPAGRAPRPENHPISQACLSCHRWGP